MKKIAVLSTLAVFFALSCDLLGGGSGSGITFIPSTRTFNAFNLVSNDYDRITADLMFTGDHVLVYVDQDVSASVDDFLAAEIGMEFDANIYNLVRTNFAVESDQDRNGKVILLLLDIQDGYPLGGNGYVAGFFDETHMFNKITEPDSNESEILFMDIYPGLLNEYGAINSDAFENFKVTMAHEFQHLVNFSEKYIRGGGKRQDLWINEGLSSAAEYLYLGHHVQWKIDYYNNDTSSIPEGQTFVSWGARENLLGNYSTVYLFFQWLRIQATNGSGIYKEILLNPNVDFSAVEQAANSSMYPGTWNDFLRDWLIANYYYRPKGKYGYEDSLGTTPLKAKRFVPQPAVLTHSLYPGEGIYIGISAPYFGSPSKPIAYAGMDTSTYSVDTGTTGSYVGDVLLTYNYAGRTGLPVAAPIPTTGVVAPPPIYDSLQAVKSFESDQKIYPIDFVLGPENRTAGKAVLLNTDLD